MLPDITLSGLAQGHTHNPNPAGPAQLNHGTAVRVLCEQSSSLARGELWF